MKMMKLGLMGLVIVLMNHTTGYTSTTELLRRIQAKPQFDVNDVNETMIAGSLAEDLKMKPVDLFHSLDKDNDQLLDRKELSAVSNKYSLKVKNMLFQKDADLDGMLSLNEYLMKEIPKADNPSGTTKAVVLFFNDYGIMSGIIALIILFAGIRYTLNSN